MGELMTHKQQFTVVLARVKCIIPMIEGTNDGASKGERSGETDGVIQVTPLSGTTTALPGKRLLSFPVTTILIQFMI
jgi:hypothetical protein